MTDGTRLSKLTGKQGYPLLDPAWPESLLCEARSVIEALLAAKRAKMAGADPRTRETESDLHRKSGAVREIIAPDFFLQGCLGLLGPDADLRFCFTLTKTLKHGGPVSWNQDWGLDQDAGHPRFNRTKRDSRS